MSHYQISSRTYYIVTLGVLVLVLLGVLVYVQTHQKIKADTITSPAVLPDVTSPGA